MGHVFSGNTFAGADCGNNGTMVEVVHIYIDWVCLPGQVHLSE